ncbi:MAG: hypothetical protein IPQ07_24505 [Myxococcales bacterium]|nr:hypothetical protein [Myxococcales bacterium]
MDERMALMGYRYFLHDSWHWPLFLNHAIHAPGVKSVAFLDCIPIWALANKALATLVPPWREVSAHAYLGLWHGLAYALQPCLGVACLRVLGHRSWREAIATAVIFIAIPTWIARYGHPALSAHWILLWALYLYLRTPPGERSSRNLGLAKLCQLVVASLVTPYHAALSLSVFVPSVLRSRDRRTLVTWIPLGLACVGVACWFAGYFAAEARRPQWGFEWNSANVLSWLVPPRSGILGDAQWIANVNPTPWQYEGYAYLGLGVLALLALFLPHARSLRPVLGRHRWLFVVVVGSSVFALSNQIFFGSHELLTYRIPSLLRWIPQQFRSPGRFVWIPTYTLVLFLLHWAYTRFATGRRFAVIAIAALLQLVDASGEWAHQRATTQGRHEPVLALDAWRPLVHAHHAVSILPPYGCVVADNANVLDRASMELQQLASERALPINGTYNARETRDCAAEQRAWTTLDLEADALYIVLSPALAVADRLQTQGAHCRAFTYGRVCSTNEAALSAATLAGVLLTGDATP